MHYWSGQPLCVKVQGCVLLAVTKRALCNAVWMGVIPVSYTHLDVYKRQLDDRLERTVKKYEESGDIVTCLKTISHLQKL